MKINEVLEIAKWFNESELTSFEWKEEESKLKLEKGGVQAVSEVSPSSVVKPIKTEVAVSKEERNVTEEPAKAEEKEEGFIVTSPVVGTYYSSPSPEDKPFVEVGQRVSKGDVVCIVEAMKLLNEITSPVDGIVKEIFVQNESLLEFEQKIMRIEV